MVRLRRSIGPGRIATVTPVAGAFRRSHSRLIRIASLAFLAGAGLFLHGCGDDNQISPPPDPNAIVWTRLTNPSTVKNPLYPEWRDSTVAFQYNDQFNNVHLGRMKLNGSDLVLYTEAGPTVDVFPRWVNDSLIIYLSNKAGGGTHFDIWYRNISAENTRILEYSSEIELGVAPKPGLPSFTYTEGTNFLRGRIALVPDTTAVPLTRLYLTPDTLKAGESDWDPAGNRICFSADASTGARNLWLLTMSGNSVASMRKLTFEEVHDLTPRFSPDGTKILFRSDRNGKSGIWWVTPDTVGALPHLITFDDVGATIVSPSWSPDGTEIILSSDHQGSRALYILSNLKF
jgi:hypothetical protein